MKEIIVNSWSRSGTTWLIHLLSDLLDSPQQDLPGGKIIGCWEKKCDGDYVIRKRHAQYHSRYKDRTVVLIHRDPRAVVVSIAFYLNIDFYEAIDMMAGYEKWIRAWLNHAQVITRYKDLSDSNELKRIVKCLTAKVLPDNKIIAAMKRQRFENIQRQFGNHFARCGKVGDWHNHLNSDHLKRIDDILGDFIKEQYDSLAR